MIPAHTNTGEKSSKSITAIDPQISSSDVLGRITEQESDRPHEVFGIAHSARRNQRGPFILQLCIFVEDLARSTEYIVSYPTPEPEGRRGGRGTYKAVMI